MRDHNPHPRSTWIRSVTFVAAALCLAFTEGQGPPVWRTVTTADATMAAVDLAALHPGQVAASVRAHLIRRLGVPGFCGQCTNYQEYHIAVQYPGPGAGYGPGDHGWHSEWREGRPCLYEHPMCTTGSGQFAQASAGELTGAIVRAAAEADAPLLAALLALPDVHANSGRSAIQVAGCDGLTIAGHVPVPRNLLEAAQVLVTEALN